MKRIERMLWMACAPGLFAVAATGLGARQVSTADPVLELQADVVGAGSDAMLRVELFRWSTDEEREALLEAWTTAPPPPPPPPEPEPAAEGREGRGRGGRGGRGRGAAPAPPPPPTPAERLRAAVRAAPTVGFVWVGGPTGYSIRYAWHADAPGEGQRIVLAIDRRLGAHSAAWPSPSGPMADAGFTVIEMRLDADGTGEGKTSLAADLVVDAGETLALDGYDAAPVFLDVTP